MTDQITRKVQTTELSHNADKSSWLNNSYIKAATSDNTRIAYRSDIRHFENWGGKLPASTESIIQYLQFHADKLNPRTLSRRVTALKHWHAYQELRDPTTHPAIQKTLLGIMRVHGKPKQKAPPLLLEDLLAIVKHLNTKNTLSAFRDNAILQIGFFGALRRSELVAIQYENIHWIDAGIDLLIPHSKTDQTHAGQYCGITYGKEILCPVTALKNWLDVSGINAGPIFREIKKDEKIMQNALSPITVNHILKKRGSECNLKNAKEYSGHSLRRGLATVANLAGASLSSIMQQGRWKEVSTIMEYVDASNRFSNNVMMKILQQLKE